MLMQRRKRATRRTAAAAAKETPSAKTAPGPQPSRKLHSMAGLLSERVFEGGFNARGATYQFTYAPTTASVTNRKLELIGRLSVRGPRRMMRTADGVRATLMATQGGVNSPSPTRRQLTVGTPVSSNVATPDQQQEQAKAPETSPQPAAPPVTPPLTVSEWTGPLSFVGVMYFRLQPLDGTALGVPIDLSSVQLNARFAPESDLERDLQVLYSDLVEAVYGEKPDERKANDFVKEINRVLKA